MRLPLAMMIAVLLAGCAAAPAGEGSAAAELSNAKLIETREGGGEGVLRLYPDGRATYAGDAEQWSGVWRVENGLLCLEARSRCYRIENEGGRAYRARAAGEEPLSWWLMKRLDEEGNVYR